MSIKTKETIKGTIKTLDKGKIVTEKAKSSLVGIKERGENSYGDTNENNANEYAINRLSAGGRNAVYNSNKIKTKGNEAIRDTKNNFIKTKNKIKTIKSKLTEKKKIKEIKNKIKTSKNVVKNVPKVANLTIKTTERARQLAIKTAKATYKCVKVTIKATISAIKGIVAGTKGLISLLLAGGWVAVVVIIIICLLGLFLNSIFGIFFSGEKTTIDAMTMKDIIAECNQEFSDKLQSIQEQNPHDEYVLDGNMASWKDMLIVYTVKISNGINEEDVITITEEKKKIMKDIFWDMNILSSEVKNETIIEKGINTDELPKEVEKTVLHIIINSKTLEQMKKEYNFNQLQIKECNELLSEDYASLWSGIIYGLDSGVYTTWRQNDKRWSNNRIGNTTSTIGEIGCLITSISILVEKSGIETNIIPFNPGTFVDKLNQVNGFDNKGNLQYKAISVIVPQFKYMDTVDLRNKSKNEKFSIIKKYIEDGYYLTTEVKGATAGNQHWVAITDVEGNNIYIVDPASNYTELWPSYDWDKTTQFIYFKVKV